MLMRTRESCGFEGPKRFTMALPVKFGGLEKTERLTGLVYVYEQLWPVATGIDNGPVFSDLCSPLGCCPGPGGKPLTDPQCSSFLSPPSNNASGT